MFIASYDPRTLSRSIPSSVGFGEKTFIVQDDSLAFLAPHGDMSFSPRLRLVRFCNCVLQPSLWRADGSMV